MPLYVLLLFLYYFSRFLFFTVCLLYAIARMNMYVMFLLRQRRLNKLINLCGHYFHDTPMTVYRWRVVVLSVNVFVITGKDKNKC